MQFRNRTEAGRRLAEHLAEYAGCLEVLVLGLPRGGLPVAFEVAQRLGAPLDVFVVRKLGVPGYEELAMGAIASGGARVLNDEVLASMPDAEARLEEVAARESIELERREQRYRGDRAPLDVRGRTVIIVDDGLATGATMRAAVAALRKRGAARIVVAVPVGATSTCAQLQREADELVCVNASDRFRAVGQFYDDFSQTTDEEVCALLAQSHSGERGAL